MKILFVFLASFGVGGGIIWYALWGRAWLKKMPWSAPFFAWIEPIEIVLYKKSETILIARFKMLIGLTLTILTMAGQIDLTPIMPLVPEKYQFWVRAAFNLLPMVITIVGWIDQQLRYDTTKPTELVALPDKVMEQNPKVAEAVAMADATKHEALAVIAVEEKKAA